MLRRILIYFIILCIAFVVVSAISVIQHWEYISKSLFDSLGVILCSCGVLAIIGIGLYTIINSLRR